MTLRLLILWLCLASNALAAGRGVVLITDQSGREEQLYTESHALLIGVSDYTNGWPDLESVPREMDQVQKALVRQGFNVIKYLNPTGSNLEDEFEGFINKHGYKPENRLLFYFSGHGHTWEDDNQGFLVPSDAPLPEEEIGNPGQEFLRKALPMSQILAWSRQMTAKHALFLFDSCFSGTVFKTKSLPKRPPHISRATRQKVRQFITAGSAGEQVPARSVFTPAFVDALEYRWGDLNRDGYITGMELGLYLQSKVPEHGKQSPQFGKHPDYHLSRGDFLFETGQDNLFSSAPDDVRPPPADSPADRYDRELELAFWNSVQKQCNRGMYRTYLDQFPGGRFVEIARQQLRDLDSWEQAERDGTRRAIEDYLMGFPEGCFAEIARSKLSGLTAPDPPAPPVDSSKLRPPAALKYFDVTNVRYDDVLNMRERPHHKSPIVGTIPPDGRCVAFQDQAHKLPTGNWVEVRYRGTVGWVNARYLESVGAGRYRVVNVESWDVLNMREAADHRSAKIGEMPPGALCEAYSPQRSVYRRWLLVDYKGRRGWVNSDYLREAQGCR